MNMDRTLMTKAVSERAKSRGRPKKRPQPQKRARTRGSGRVTPASRIEGNQNLKATDCTLLAEPEVKQDVPLPLAQNALHNDTDDNPIAELKRRKKSLSLQDLQKPKHMINVLSVSTDLCEQETVTGPWEYCNPKKCIVTFTCDNSDTTLSMRLDHLLERGLPQNDSSSLVFRWYSWIRFKRIAKLNSISLKSALNDDKKFLFLLQEVNNFYMKSSYYQKIEGLEPNSGPQSFFDVTNIKRLYYYGLGTIKYYRRTTFLQLVAEKYGENVKAEFLIYPETPLIDPVDYEELLDDVHKELSQHYSRHLNKLQNYAGPQCNEDRLYHSRVHYDVKFTQGVSKTKTSEAEKNVCGNIKRVQMEQLKVSEFYLRKCRNCHKIRWVEKWAAKKFVLGSYSYGNTDTRVHFSCEFLHSTSCDDEDDIMPLEHNEESPSIWVAYMNSDDASLPPAAFAIKTLRFISEGISDAEIVAKYACSSNEMNHCRYRVVCTKLCSSGRIEIGQRLGSGRFRRYQDMPALSRGKLTRHTPREALVCQSWLDDSQHSSEDPSARFTVTNLSGIKDLHATYGAMKMVHCLQCGMCSPGLEGEADECVTVPEAGKDVPLANQLLLMTIKQSQILSNCGVVLDPRFAAARVYKNETVAGVCTECSEFCEIDEDGVVTLLHRESTDDEEQHSQDTNNSQEPIHDNISNINPYSVDNLMALDVFQDDASQQYAMFMDTLSQAEKLVLSPIHAVIVILRSRTNNVPFSRHGSISFAIKEPVKTRSLPWHTFQQLPFVVMLSRHEDGSMNEAKVNMAKIVHAKEMMEREVTCPVYGTKRPFYRYCDKVHTPFTVTAMETLASQLSDTNKAVLPEGLRKINIDAIHERATKRLNVHLFSEWLNSGFTIGNGMKDAFVIECHDSEQRTSNNESTAKQLWKAIGEFVKLQNNDREDKNFEVTKELVHITPRDVTKYGVEKGWLDPSADIPIASEHNVQDVTLREDELNHLTYLCCEELELLLRENSNDEGSSGNVAQGGVVNMETESPDEILRRGMQHTVLERIPAPEVDRQHPVAEHSPGYLQMAFPDVFLTGDGCPHQERPRSITNSSGSYIFHYLKWVSQQPRAMVNTELQFLIHSMMKRQHSRGKAKLALRNDAFDQYGIPVKEDLMQNAQLRDWTVSNLMMFKSSIPDSTPFWKRARDDAISVQRDWEETVPWREEKSPMSVMLFQTRAPPYNHHPAIHHLCPDAKKLFDLSDEEYFDGRRRNVLKYPGIISFMCGLMAELDTKYLSKLRYNGDSYFTRFEWGANANPHAHKLYFSQGFSENMERLKQRIDSCFQHNKDEAVNNGQDLQNHLVQESIRTKVLACWDQARDEYIEYMRPFYTNWNAGLLKDGQNRTFDFVYNRKSTISRLDMATVIDEALTSGHFSKLDTVYVSVANGTCRHLGHSGINDQPAKTDRCAVVKKKRVKSTQPGKKQYKEIVTCKRRKPQPVSDKPTIEPDPHNRKLVQLKFESNDKWFNGHDPFQILHILSNADDKAIVPHFLRKPPVISISKNREESNAVDLNMMLFSDVGESDTEYTTKYTFKDVVTTKTSAEVLVTAMEKLNDGDPINQGTVQKMYNAHAIAGTTSIFQATHLNQKIPLVLSNVNIKHCSVSGLSLLRNDYDPDDGENYLIPPLIQQFDARHDSTVVCKEGGKVSAELKAEIQSDMCLHQFCDLYDVKEVKPDGKGERTLLFKRRSSARQGRLNALKLIPCHGLKVANPNDNMHWNYCRTLCLWKIPCHKTTDFTPVGENDDSIKKGWIDLFNSTFDNGEGLPPWAHRYWKHYNLPRDKTLDVSSDEDVEENQDVSMTESSECWDKKQIGDHEEDDDYVRPKAHQGNEQFYQNPVDRMRAAPQNTVDDINFESSSNCDADVLANPEGVDFMSTWLGDRVIPSTAKIHTQLADLINTEGELSGRDFNSSTLNEKQKMAHDIVVEYVTNRLHWEQNDRQGPAPKPLRLILMGNPGTGKSWTLKCFMSTLATLMGNITDTDGKQKPAWPDRIKLAAPTGAASSQMHFKAETLHRLFSVPIHLSDKAMHLEETSAGYARLMLNFDPQKFLLLVIDEFSMVSRQMFAFITQRLDQCNIKLDNIGIVLIGDPAQILPIASDPLWSARLHTDQGKDCSSLSLTGMARFREAFDFSPLQKIPEYEKWKTLTEPKQRLLSDEITACRKDIMKCNFDAVFLTEVKRSDDDPVSQDFTRKILVNLRYGKKCREKEMNFLRKHCATAIEVNGSDKWNKAHIIHGYHFHSKDDDNRPSVEADNARALIRHHNTTGNPIMRIDSLHRPAAKQEKLKALPAKEFEGAPPHWHASKGMRVMLLRNLAPSLGLYNGSMHTLVGPIYSNDTVEVCLTREHLKAAALNDSVTTQPIDICSKERQIPAKSTLLSVNGVTYAKATFDQLSSTGTIKCKFHVPQNPPAIPDFMVIEASNYNGLNILNLDGCENYVPIPPVESYKPVKPKSKTPKEQLTRIALPLEGGDAATGFKGQGANYPLAEVDLEAWFHIPGIFLVAISRVRSPQKLHLRKFPKYLDIKLQRLKENVLDAQAFEEAIRVKSEWLYRHQDNPEDKFWNLHTNAVADETIEMAVLNGLSIKKDRTKLMQIMQNSCKDTNRNTILDVINKLIESKEYLVSEKAPHLTTDDFNALENYQKKKSVKRKVIDEEIIKKTVTKRSKATPASVRQLACDRVDIPQENLLSLKPRPSGATFKGLVNSGNNVCIINAAIISLCYTEAFDTFLRTFHTMHQGCEGHMFGQVSPCPLCALYEIFNRAYRHHQIRSVDVRKTPIIKLTQSLLSGWHIGSEHDADEFLTKLLELLDETLGCNIHKGIRKMTRTCQRCGTSRIKEDGQPTAFRCHIHLAQFDDSEIHIQEGIDKWLTPADQMLTCINCGQTLHSMKREVVNAPQLFIITVQRDGMKETEIDHRIIVSNHAMVFRASINFHPHHYTAVGSTASNSFVYYSDEEVQNCNGALSGRGRKYEAMNRVRTPLRKNATVLLYECNTR